MSEIDLNGDLGEGAAHDGVLLRYVTSANIACGAHAGDESTMRSAVAGALAAGVAIGAHPGYEDRDHFGRVETGDSPARIAALVDSQVRALQDIASELGGRVTHVKPHGALYHRAALDSLVAETIARTVAACDPSLAMFTLEGSALAHASHRIGLRVIAEGFADRAYSREGRLVPRGEPGAVLTSAGDVAAQAVSIAVHGSVISLEGTTVHVIAQTLCLHGDTGNGAELVRALRAALTGAGVTVRSYRTA